MASSAAIGAAVGGLGQAGQIAASVKGAREAEKESRKLAERLTQLASDFDISVEELIFAFNNPNLGNAVLSGASASVLSQLGQPVGGALRQGGPLGLVINAAGAAGLTEEQFNDATNSARKAAAQYRKFRAQGASHEVASRRAIRKSGGSFRRLSTLAGFTQPGDFLRSQFEFEQEVGVIEAEQRALAPETRAARNDAQRTINSLFSDFPVRNEEELRELEGRVRAERLAEITENREESDEEILQQANVFGLNPGRQLADNREQFDELRFDLDNTQALERAILLASGESQQAVTGLTALLGGLNEPIRAALGVAGLQSQGQQVQGDLSLRQAIALNDLRFREASAEAFAEFNLLKDALGIESSGELGTIAAKTNAGIAAGQSLIDLGGSIGGSQSDLSGIVGNGSGGGGTSGGGGGGGGGIDLSSILQLLGGGGSGNLTSGPAVNNGASANAAFGAFA